MAALSVGAISECTRGHRSITLEGTRGRVWVSARPMSLHMGCAARTIPTAATGPHTTREQRRSRRPTARRPSYCNGLMTELTLLREHEMADFTPRDGSGSLFRNNKRDKETQPNARGDAMIGGVLYEVSAWTKKDKNGNPWQSLAFKPKEARPAAETAWGADIRKPAPVDFDDDIAF